MKRNTLSSIPTTQNSSKKRKSSLIFEFEESSPQYVDLRIKHPNKGQFFNLPPQVNPSPAFFLKLILNVDLIKILIPVNLLKLPSPSNNYDFFWKFIAVWISMGLMHLSNIRCSHFHQNSWMRNRVAKLFMTRNLFEKILYSLKESTMTDLSNTFQSNGLSFILQTCLPINHR